MWLTSVYIISYLECIVIVCSLSLSCISHCSSRSFLAIKMPAVCLHVIVNRCMKWLIHGLYSISDLLFACVGQTNIKWCFQLGLTFSHPGCFVLHIICGFFLLYYVITVYLLFAPMQVMWCNQRAKIKQLMCDIVVHI